VAQTEMVTFKGSRRGLFIDLPEDTGFTSIKRELQEKLASAKKFFRGADVVVNVGRRTLTTDQLLDIEDILRFNGGLRLAEIIHDPEERELDRSRLSQRTILVKRTLRSGQRVRYDGNVVVMGDVNPGAEVVASGDVVVLGRLRGVVHAGARGRSDAVVAATWFEPLQLRIADVICRAPERYDGKSPGRPEVARIQNGVVVVDPFTSNCCPTQGTVQGGLAFGGDSCHNLR